MDNVIWGVDFRKKRFDNEEMVQLAKEVMGLIETRDDRTIYESSLGFIAPENDPA
jgi:hypothetical protein